MSKIDKILNNPGRLVSYGILLAMVCGAIYFTMNLPKRVDAMEQDIVDLKKIMFEQQRINDYYYRPPFI